MQTEPLDFLWRFDWIGAKRYVNPYDANWGFCKRSYSPDAIHSDKMDRLYWDWPFRIIRRWHMQKPGDGALYWTRKREAKMAWKKTWQILWVVIIWEWLASAITVYSETVKQNWSRWRLQTHNGKITISACLDSQRTCGFETVSCCRDQNHEGVCLGCRDGIVLPQK